MYQSSPQQVLHQRQEPVNACSVKYVTIKLTHGGQRGSLKLEEAGQFF